MAEKNENLQKQRGGKGLAIKGAITKTDTDVPEIPPKHPNAVKLPPKHTYRG